MLRRLLNEMKPAHKPVSSSHFIGLRGEDVITAKLSDHHPIVHDGILFWNIMMQGKMRQGKGSPSYNNAFGMVESDSQYKKRLVAIAQVIAEIVLFNPAIEIIGLCEGPIHNEHSAVLMTALQQFKWMQRFFAGQQWHQPQVANAPAWGLLMLTDHTKQVEPVACQLVENSPHFSKLANRLQVWQITQNKQTKYFALAHFPFAGDERVTDKAKLSVSGQHYCDLVTQLFKRYENEQFVICADFNFNPYLLTKWQDRALDQITPNNSILLTCAQQSIQQSVTVDGILLSSKAKQKFYWQQSTEDFLGRQKQEFGLFRKSVKTNSTEVPFVSQTKKKLLS